MDLDRAHPEDEEAVATVTTEMTLVVKLLTSAPHQENLDRISLQKAENSTIVLMERDQSKNKLDDVHEEITNEADQHPTPKHFRGATLHTVDNAKKQADKKARKKAKKDAAKATRKAAAAATPAKRKDPPPAAPSANSKRQKTAKTVRFPKAQAPGKQPAAKAQGTRNPRSQQNSKQNSNRRGNQRSGRGPRK